MWLVEGRDEIREPGRLQEDLEARAMGTDAGGVTDDGLRGVVPGAHCSD